MSTGSRSRTIRRGVAAVLVVGVLAALGIPAINHLRDASERRQTGNEFRLLTIGLWGYNDTHGHLPELAHRIAPSGDAGDADNEILYGWRFTLIPFSTGLTGGQFPPERPRVDFYSPWTSGSNAWLRDASLTEYCYEGHTDTRVVAVTGPGTAWGDGVAPPRSLEDVPADTIVIVEIANSGIHWAEPGDLDIRTMPQTINDPSGRGISSRSTSAFCVGFADGRVWMLSHDIPFTTLEKFFTIDGAAENSSDELLAPFRIE